MTVGELIKKLNKRDKAQTVYYIDKFGKHEITDVEPMLTKDGSVTIIMNGDGGRYDRKTEPHRPQGEWIKRHGTINCSVCKRSNWSACFEDTVRSFNFCPNCGAYMREREGE